MNAEKQYAFRISLMGDGGQFGTTNPKQNGAFLTMISPDMHPVAGSTFRWTWKGVEFCKTGECRNPLLDLANMDCESGVIEALEADDRFTQIRPNVYKFKTASGHSGVLMLSSNEPHSYPSETLPPYDWGEREPGGKPVFVEDGKFYVDES